MLSKPAGFGVNCIQTDDLDRDTMFLSELGGWINCWGSFKDLYKLDIRVYQISITEIGGLTMVKTALSSVWGLQDIRRFV